MFIECKYVIQGIIGCDIYDLVTRLEGPEVFLTKKKEEGKIIFISIIMQGIV